MAKDIFSTPPQASAIVGQYNATPLTVTDGKYIVLQTDVNGKLLVAGTITSTPSGTQTTTPSLSATQPSPLQFRAVNLAATAQAVKTSAGKVLGFNIINPGNAPAYVKFYDKASAPTVGTDTITTTIMVPSTATVFLEASAVAQYSFASKIYVAATLNLVDSDTTAPASNLTIDVLYE